MYLQAHRITSYNVCYTKLLRNNEKSYTADFALGKITDTQDITGNVVKTFDKTVSREEIENILNNFV